MPATMILVPTITLCPVTVSVTTLVAHVAAEMVLGVLRMAVKSFKFLNCVTVLAAVFVPPCVIMQPLRWKLLAAPACMRVTLIVTILVIVLS
jgi:hypothetical protein